jgi:hypothetical protein
MEGGDLGGEKLMFWLGFWASLYTKKYSNYFVLISPYFTNLIQGESSLVSDSSHPSRIF